MWWVIHAWDYFLADRFIPQWSYGFSTLTKYPDPDPETTSVDGNVNRALANETWGTIRAGAGSNAGAAASEDYFIRMASTGTSNQWSTLHRAIFLFDTSALTSGATISAAVLSLFGVEKLDEATAITPNIDIYTSTPASNTDLAASDYGNIGSTSQTGSPISYASFSDVGYNNFTLDSTGRGNISKTGVSKFGCRNANYDVANSAPTWTASKNHYLYGYFADRTGTTNDPKMVVTYTAVTNYPLTAAQGSFTYTGQTSLLKIGHKIIAALGSYSLTGFATLFSRGKLLMASVGTYIYTGYNTTITSVRTMVAALGTYVLTGRNALFSVGHTIIANVGSFAYTGMNAILLIAKTMTAAYGSFTLTGQNATFRIARLLTAAYGLVSITWQNFQLRLNGFLAIYSNKFTHRNTSYSDKYSSRDTSYTDKYTHLE